MLRTPLHAVLLEAADPHGGVLAHPHGVDAEGARLNDRVPGLEVQVAYGGEGPVDADRARLGPGDDPGGGGRLEIVEPAERGGRRQLGEPLDLLRRPALEVRADQQGVAGLLAQRRGKGRYRVARASEDDEPAHACRQRRVDLGALVGEALPSPAERGEHEARERRGHAGVTWPRTRGPRAPVAAGRLPACPASVRCPRKANTRASFASPSKNS